MQLLADKYHVDNIKVDIYFNFHRNIQQTRF